MRGKIVGGIVLFICVAIFFSPHPLFSQSAPENNAPPELVTVLRIVDGDTEDVGVSIGTDPTTGKTLWKKWRVRNIGIDAPEKSTHDPYWRMSADHLAELIPVGSVIRMEREAIDSNAYWHKRRYLRDIYIPSAEPGGSEVFVNFVMVFDGFARASPYHENTDHADELQQAEDDARAHHRGIWLGSSKE